MTKKILIFSFIVLLTFIANAQKSDYIKDFDYLVEKIKNDYPGYNDKVNVENIFRPETFGASAEKSNYSISRLVREIF